MRLTNLNALRMFDAAARHRNFRLAAEELGLTQGAVAQQVRRLEADLGLRLFDRNARGLALTDAGRRYHGPVSRAFELIAEATRMLRPEGMRVTLSVTPSFASKWLVPRLARFERAHPEIELRTVASERTSDFRSDGVDLAVRQGRAPSRAALSSVPLAPIDLCAVCSPEVAERLGPVSGIGDLAGARLLQDSHALWQELFAEAGIPAPARTMQFNQTALAIDAAANGQGVALAPRLLLDAELASGRLVVLWTHEGAVHDGFHLIHPRTQRTNPARDAVVAWLVAEIG